MSGATQVIRTLRNVAVAAALLLCAGPASAAAIGQSAAPSGKEGLSGQQVAQQRSTTTPLQPATPSTAPTKPETKPETKPTPQKPGVLEPIKEVCRQVKECYTYMVETPVQQQIYDAVLKTTKTVVKIVKTPKEVCKFVKKCCKGAAECAKEEWNKP